MGDKETLESTYARLYAALWFYSLKAEGEEEDLEPGTRKNGQKCHTRSVSGLDHPIL